MKKINVNEFKQVGFFLSSRKEVTSLDEARTYGGVTKFDGKFYSNYEENNCITLAGGENKLSVIIPSTLDADKSINNTEYVEKYLLLLAEKYSDLSVEKSIGSWYSENLDKVIVEENCIITVSLKGATEKDINILLDLGLMVKEEMTQESVSVLVNDSLCLV